MHNMITCRHYQKSWYLHNFLYAVLIEKNDVTFSPFYANTNYLLKSDLDTQKHILLLFLFTSPGASDLSSSVIIYLLVKEE